MSFALQLVLAQTSPFTLISLQSQIDFLCDAHLWCPQSLLIELLNRFIQPFLFLLSPCCLFFVVQWTCITLNVRFSDSLENACKELSDGIYNLDRWIGLPILEKNLIALLYFAFLRYTLCLEQLYSERISLFRIIVVKKNGCLHLSILFIRTNSNQLVSVTIM